MTWLSRVPRVTFFKRVMRLWPPFMGAGIRVTEVTPDSRYLRVEMGLHAWNKNYVGTHFGGSLYSMVDPFYMVMVLENMGKGYTVWDKCGSIQYKYPGKGTVYAEFKLSEGEIERIKKEADAAGKTEPQFTINIYDSSGNVVAEVQKTLSVRRKDRTSGREPNIS